MRRGHTLLELRSHFLQIRRYGCDLLFLFRKLGSEILLLLGKMYLQFPYFAMLFEKLVEQHGVHLIIADAVDIALFVVNHKVRTYPLHVFSYESELQRGGTINLLLITEGRGF